VIVQLTSLWTDSAIHSCTQLSAQCLTFLYSCNIYSYMKRNSQLSSMLHLLLHMAQAGRHLTSEELADMLRTNPVLVRRTLAGLRERGIVSAEKGHGGGWVLARTLDAITLYDVYEALGEPELFAIGHRSLQSQCLLEQAVTMTLDQTLSEAAALVVARLGAVTLAALSEDFMWRNPNECRGRDHQPGPASERSMNRPDKMTPWRKLGPQI
jgi:DNA-binding IscR family transcriptional regulator